MDCSGFSKFEKVSFVFIYHKITTWWFWFKMCLDEF